MAVNTSFGELLATSIKNYRQKLTENITTTEVLFWEMTKSGNFEERDGGATIVEPLMYAENSNVGSYDGADELPVAREEVIDAAEFAWKQVAGTMTHTGREEFQNSGSKVQMVNLIKSKLQNLELSLQLEINRQLHADGTGNGGKDITGLAAAIEDGTAWSTYGGIDSNANTFWRNGWTGSVGSFGTGLNAAGIKAMRSLYYGISRGKDTPKLIFTTQTVYELYETALATNVYIMNDRFTNAGFEDHLKFKNAVVFYDADAASGAMTFINPTYLKFVLGAGKNFVTLPSVRPGNQDVWITPTLVYCQLILNNRRRQGRLDGITA